MARKPTTGLKYFPFDVDFFNDDKIELIEAEYGIKGVHIAIKLLCKIYKENGYYYQWGDDQCLLFSSEELKYDDLEFVKEVVDKIVSRGYFNKVMFENYNVLTSVEIQKNWLKLTDNVFDYQTSPYRLIENPKIPLYKKHDFRPRMNTYNVAKWYEISKFVFKRDNYTCFYCGQIGGILEVDHIQPYSKGGTDDLENLTTACRKCNRQKKDKTVAEFKKWKLKQITNGKR